MEKRIYIGIDPGVQTGIAVWDGQRKKFIHISTLKIHGAMKYVENWATILLPPKFITAYIENPNTYIGWESREKANMKRAGAGSIKRDYSIWRDFLADLGVDVVPVRLQKTLKKLDAEQFKRITGITQRTSYHSRDAAMLVFDR